MTEWILCL